MGSVGPTGKIFKPVGIFSHAEAVEMFHEQAEGLTDGGVDVLWLETISSREDISPRQKLSPRMNCLGAAR